MEGKPIDLGLTALDELFMTEEGRKESRLPRIRDIPLSQIDDMPNHPYKVRMDEDMEALVESVKNHGIITPVILRQKEDGRYECASGHRRRKAAELAGFSTVPAEVRDMTRDEAIIIMAHSNRQRSRILPSEKAFSYKMELEAMNRKAGRPPTDNLTPVVSEKNLRTNEELGEKVGESREQIRRYIRLTFLTPALLDMVDQGRIAFRPAVELSYLTEQEQTDLFDTISWEDATPSLAQAIKLKTFSREGRLNADVILSIMQEQKPNQKEKITFHAERLRPYLPKNIDPRQTEDYILKALEYYQRYREQRKREGGAR